MKIALVICFLTTLAANSATLYITNAPYNGIGDYTEVYVSATTNSATLTTTNQFVAGDVGKVVQLFAGGRKATLSGSGQFNGDYGGTPTNYQDVAAYIASVGTLTITLNRICGHTASNLRMGYGTDNRSAFTNIIASAASNDTIRITAGNYQVMNQSALDTNFVQTGQYDYGIPAITISKGGFTMLGDGTNSSIITANGTWQQKGFDQAFRGSFVFLSNGPNAPTNNGPVIYSDIWFNGNSDRNNHTQYVGFPAVPTDGSGWDPTHHCFTDSYTPNGNTYKSWTNCLFTHWHGELLQGIADSANGIGFIDVGNCVFLDGYSTVINFNYRHDFHDCLVADTYQFAEDGQFVPGSGTSRILNNVFTNIYGVLACGLGGAVTNVAAPGYLVCGNVFYGPSYAITLAGTTNVTITSNTFHSTSLNLSAAGSQGNMWNGNVTVSYNSVPDTQQTFVLVGSSYANRVENADIFGNSALSLTEGFGEVFGYLTNVTFYGNTSSKGLLLGYPGADTGQWFLDDPSNVFPSKKYSDGSGITNIISYENGYRHEVIASISGSAFVLTNNVSKIPFTARMLITNANNGSTTTTRINVNAGVSTNLPVGGAFVAQWTGNQWILGNYARGTIARVSTAKPQ